MPFSTTPISRASPQGPPEPAEKEIEETRWPSWVNPYGGVAAALSALAFFSGSLLGQWLVTIGLLAAGLSATFLGVWATRKKRQNSDVLCLATGAGLSGFGLFLALVAPGVLNPFWDRDFAVAKADPDQQVQVGRTQPRGKGRPLSPDDWTDAARDLIRQDDVLVGVNSVEFGPLPDKENAFLKIHVYIGNIGYGRHIPFQGFAGENRPVLRDDSGHAYFFLEQRWRKRRPGLKGIPLFETAPARLVNVPPNRNAEVLLLFEGSPAPNVQGGLKLELPAAAWGRSGVCKFLLAGLISAPNGQ